jgi:hypothetical protein
VVVVQVPPFAANVITLFVSIFQMALTWVLPEYTPSALQFISTPLPPSAVPDAFCHPP